MISPKDKLTKRQIKLISKIWVGSMAYYIDGAFNEEESGMPEESMELMISEANNLGAKLLGTHPSFGDIREIVKYVKELKHKL